MWRDIYHDNRHYIVNDQTHEVKDVSSDPLDIIGNIFTGGLLDGDTEPSTPIYNALKNN